MPAAFAGIGVAVAGSLGAGAIGFGAAVLTGVVTSALVGAAIGGISAAVMGGDIGKGLLFGAVGGVVTGGLAGGLIAPQSSALLQSQGATWGSTITMGAQGGTSAMTSGIGGGYGSMAGSGGTQMVSTAAKAPFGGALTGMKGQVAGQLVKAVGAGLMPGQEGPQEDWGKTEAGYRFLAKEAKDQLHIKGKYSGGGGGGPGPNYTREVAQINATAAMERLQHETAQRTKEIKLQHTQGMESMKEEYKLSKDAATHKFGLERGVFEDASKAAASTEYQSGQDAYEAIKAAQEERGYEQDYGRYPESQGAPSDSDPHTQSGLPVTDLTQEQALQGA